MIIKMKIKTFLLILIVILFMSVTLTAQLKRNGLIFSEVYLNEDKPNKSWLEIYNPTAGPLVLEKFRLYHILTSNVLPQEIQEQGGIEISPGDCIILCANESEFDFKIDTKSTIIQSSAIANFRKGGFFSLKTKGSEEEGVDIFRYGDPEVTSKLKNKLGNFVVPFSRDARSYTRIMSVTHGQRFMPNFTHTEPSPGRYVERGQK